MLALSLFALMVWALFRRFDVITIIVAFGMLAGMFFWELPDQQMNIALALLDFAVAAILAKVVFYAVNDGQRGWTDKAHRAQFIAIAACAKVAVRLAYHGDGIESWNVAAGIANAILAYQILVAGGVGHVGICRGVHSLWRAVRNYFRGGKDRGVA